MNDLEKIEFALQEAKRCITQNTNLNNDCEVVLTQLRLANKIVKKLIIPIVVKPFYCVDNCKSKGSVNKCDNQCTGCWQVEKRSKQ